MSPNDRARTSAPSLRLRKLPARYAGIVTPLILSGLMTFIVSAIATWKAIGVGAEFPGTWMEAWGVSWVIAFPTLLIVLPVVRRIVGLIVAPS
jgi:Protein of unknown function (DUF2798)